MLYNLNRVREHVRSVGTILVVEGYMDVIALWQTGLKTAVAPMGTALTEEQVGLLWKYTDRPIICLDGDEAGQRAAYRSAEMVLPHLRSDKTVGFISLPQGHDPDTYVASFGIDAFKKLMKESATLESVLWNTLSKDIDFQKAEQRAALEHSFTSLCQTIQDETIRKHYVSAFKNRLWEASRRKASHSAHGGFKKGADAKNIPQRSADQAICATLFYEPQLFEKFADDLALVKFENQQLNQFVAQGLNFLMRGTLDKASFDTYLTSVGLFDVCQTRLTSDIVAKMDFGARVAYLRRLLDEHKTRGIQFNASSRSMRQGEELPSDLEEDPVALWEDLKHKALAKKGQRNETE